MSLKLLQSLCPCPLWKFLNGTWLHFATKCVVSSTRLPLLQPPAACILDLGWVCFDGSSRPAHADKGVSRTSRFSLTYIFSAFMFYMHSLFSCHIDQWKMEGWSGQWAGAWSSPGLPRVRQSAQTLLLNKRCSKNPISNRAMVTPLRPPREVGLSWFYWQVPFLE